VVNVNNTSVHNTYVNNTVVNNNVTVNNNHTSFNGPGGVTAQARPEEQAAAREQHVQPTSDQLTHRQTAGNDRNQFASVNNGHPATAAMDKVNGNHFNAAGHPARVSAANGANSNAGYNHHATADNNPGNQANANPDKMNQANAGDNTQAQAPHHRQMANNVAGNNPNGTHNPNAGNNRPLAQGHHNPGHAPRAQAPHAAPARQHQNPRPEEHERHR
jgi:hypothetical protein